MPRKSKGARLYLRGRVGRPRTWVILDGANEISTGCGEDDIGGAEKALQQYIAEKHRPEWTDRSPDRVSIASVLDLYGRVRAPKLKKPEQVGYHMGPLLEFWGDRMCSAIDEETCHQYTLARMSGKIGRRKVKETTARRDLETLQAALGHAFSDRKLLNPITVTLPAKSAPRDRWLTRSEVAALIAGALGIVATAYDVKTREPVKWGRMYRPVYHVARFMLIALYSGTRHEAILGLRWSPNSKSGWFDLERQVMYRRGQGQAETTKRKPPVPIPENLMPHLKRWKRIAPLGPVQYADRLIQKERRGWKRARVLAGLGPEVTPHILRHTCTTWMLQRSIPIWEVAGFIGASEKVIRDTYGHHSPEHLSGPKKRFRGQNLGG